MCYLYYKYYQSFSMNRNIENNNNNSGLCASRLSGTLGIFKNVWGHLQIWNVNKHWKVVLVITLGYIREIDVDY